MIYIIISISFMAGIGFALLAGWLLDPTAMPRVWLATQLGPLRREVHARERVRLISDVILDREVALKGNPFLPIERPDSPSWREETNPVNGFKWQWFLKHRKMLNRNVQASSIKLLTRKELSQ